MLSCRRPQKCERPQQLGKTQNQHATRNSRSGVVKVNAEIITGYIGRSMATNTTEYLLLGWFKYPKSIDVNYDAFEVVYITLCVLSLPLNTLFLAIIIKNPGSKTWSNMSIILGSLCVLHLTANTLTAVNQFDVMSRRNVERLISNDIITGVLAMTYAMFFASTFLLALNTFAMIVKPLLYKTFSPKSRNMVCITLVLWLAAGGVCLALPFFLEDYREITQMTATVFCWFVTVLMIAMYWSILRTLCRRKKELQSTLNVTASRQGLLVIKQNSKLALVLFLYILYMVLLTLPISTCLLLIINCPQCDNTTTFKITLYMIPLSLSMSTLFPIHWILGSPQYYKEIKRLASKLLTCCKH